MKTLQEIMEPTIISPDFLQEKNVSEMAPQEKVRHYAKVAAAKQSLLEHLPRAEHIINHYEEATAQEKNAGHNWYSEAHHMARGIANDTNTHMHTVAGLIANYSPQTHWATNMMTASRVARTKTPIGGPDQERHPIYGKIMAGQSQKDKAQRILNGEHHSEVLTGPKIRDFAHLIEHGGDTDPHNPKVVIDRHALSVATGHRITDLEHALSGISRNPKTKKSPYSKVGDEYIKAAKHISDKYGTTVHPHQVQAVTWIVRQRKNEQDDRDIMKMSPEDKITANKIKRSSNSAKNARNAIKKWNQYAGEYHRGLVGKEPGMGYSMHDAD